MVTAIIQARMGSTRLPGKVLKSVEGATLLEYQIERVRRATCIEHIVVATSTSAGDGVLEQFCRSKGWSLFRGSEHDVLDRYYQCAERYGATPVVRLTADCPFVDPVIIDRTIQLFHDQ